MNRDDLLISFLQDHYIVEFYDPSDETVEVEIPPLPTIQNMTFPPETLNSITNIVMQMLNEGGFGVVSGVPQVRIVSADNQSYEALIRLTDLVPPVSRGATQEVINSLPTKKFEEEKSEDKCNICLAEWLKDEILITLPKCSHCFHKDCIIEWLKITKNCPICREEVN